MSSENGERVSKEEMAYHEAGHTVVAVAFGSPVVSVSLSEDGGVCDSLGYYDRVDSNDLPGTRESMRELVVELAAGHVAATMKGYPDETKLWTSDYEAIARIQNDWLRRLTVPTIERRARKLLRARWGDVVKVAEALLARRHLTGDEVLEILGAKEETA